MKLPKGKESSFVQDGDGVWWYVKERTFKNGNPMRNRAFVGVCEYCQEPYVTYPRGPGKAQRYCSQLCKNRALGPTREMHYKNKPGAESHRWNGGRFVNDRGYVMVWMPEHPNCQGNLRKYVPEHRLVMEQQLGRPLKRSERVHHKNGIKTDNRTENLELWQHGHPAGQRIQERAVRVPVALIADVLWALESLAPREDGSYDADDASIERAIGWFAEMRRLLEE